MKSLLLISVFIFANTLFAKGKNCDDVSQYKDVSLSEMKKLVKSGAATIIDVNSNSSFKKNHIPKAIHYSTNEKNFKEVLPKNKDTMVVAYCGGKMCSAWERAAKAACQLGYSNIKHFSAGITGWEKNS